MFGMSVPLPQVIQLATESLPRADGELLMKRRYSIEPYSRPLILALRRCCHRYLEMAPASQTEKDSTRLTMMASGLPVFVHLPQHGDVDEDESVVKRVAED